MIFMSEAMYGYDNKRKTRKPFEVIVVRSNSYDMRSCWDTAIRSKDDYDNQRMATIK